MEGLNIYTSKISCDRVHPACVQSFAPNLKSQSCVFLLSAATALFLCGTGGGGGHICLCVLI